MILLYTWTVILPSLIAIKCSAKDLAGLNVLLPFDKNLAAWVKEQKDYSYRNLLERHFTSNTEPYGGYMIIDYTRTSGRHDTLTDDHPAGYTSTECTTGNDCDKGHSEEQDHNSSEDTTKNSHSNEDLNSSTENDKEDHDNDEDGKDGMVKNTEGETINKDEETEKEGAIGREVAENGLLIIPTQVEVRDNTVLQVDGNDEYTDYTAESVEGPSEEKRAETRKRSYPTVKESRKKSSRSIKNKTVVTSGKHKL